MESTHEELPWYVNGTLTPEEARRFELHLRGCSPCRDERELLEEVRRAVDRYGADAYFDDHPSSEEVVAAAAGEGDADDRRRLDRHLAVCPTCSLELAWVRGDAIPGELPAPVPISMPAARPTRRAAWPLAMAAAVLLAFGLGYVLRPLPPSSGGTSSLAAAHYLEPVARASRPATVEVDPGAERFVLYLEVNVAEGEGALRVAVDDAAGRTVVEQRHDGRLHRELYLFLVCERSDFPDGTYRAQVFSEATGEPLLEYGFEVRPAAAEGTP